MQDDNRPAQWHPVVPFLNADPVYCYGVEFGMWYKDVSALEPGTEHMQYVRTENEEQMRLACIRLGWEVVELKSWDDGPPENGWVLMRVRKPPESD
jgi:hypothetical protein